MVFLAFFGFQKTGQSSSVRQALGADTVLICLSGNGLEGLLIIPPSWLEYIKQLKTFVTVIFAKTATKYRKKLEKNC
jgi:hypothetical protein